MEYLYISLFPPGSLETFGIPEELGEILILVPKGKAGIQFTNEFIAETEKSPRSRPTKRKRILH